MECHRWAYFTFSYVLHNRPQNIIQIFLRILVRPLFNVEMEFMVILLITAIELISLRNLVIDIHSQNYASLIRPTS